MALIIVRFVLWGEWCRIFFQTEQFTKVYIVGAKLINVNALAELKLKILQVVPMLAFWSYQPTGIRHMYDSNITGGKKMSWSFLTSTRIKMFRNVSLFDMFIRFLIEFLSCLCIKTNKFENNLAAKTCLPMIIELILILRWNNSLSRTQHYY